MAKKFVLFKKVNYCGAPVRIDIVSCSNSIVHLQMCMQKEIEVLLRTLRADEDVESVRVDTKVPGQNCKFYCEVTYTMDKDPDDAAEYTATFWIGAPIVTIGDFKK